jgi:hypothetical protein
VSSAARPNTLENIRQLEMRLHNSGVRADPLALAELLHPEFREFGRSGAVYMREQVLAEFAETPQPYEVWSQDYAIEELAPDLALLTYRSAHINQSGELERFTLRASLWQSGPGGWRIRFHQGTPTESFERRVAR